MMNKSRVLLFLLSITVFILGVLYVWYKWNESISTTSQRALETVKIAEAAFPKDAISKLDGNLTDLGKKEYRHIKNNLLNIASIDKNVRFTYVYAKKSDKLYFLADSEPIDSKDYSPPGQEYTEADNQYTEPFVSGQALITKPVTDRWGEWVSVLAPIKDPLTDKVIAVFAMDYPAKKWNDEAFNNTAQASVVVFVLLLLIFALFVVINNSLMVRENEKNFRAFLETINDIVIVGNKQGKILYSNSATSRKLDYKRNELTRMRILDLNPKNKRQEAEKILSDMLAGKRESCPLPLEKKDGTLLPTETRVWLGKWGGKESIFGLSKDLSGEQESLQKFNRIFEKNPALMAISSIENRKFTDVNQAFLDKIGYKKDEIVGKTAQEISLFVQSKQQEKVTNELMEKGFVHDIELQVKTKKGDLLEGRFSGEIIEIQDKKYFLTVMIDETERRRVEMEILKKNKELKTLNDFMIGRELKMIELKKEIERLKNA